VLLSNDVKLFDEYVQQRIEDARKMQQELQEPMENQELQDGAIEDVKLTPDEAGF
jgi:hypothetical protein